MKTKFKLISFLALAALMFASCAKEPTGKTPVEGSERQVMIKVTQAAAATKAPATEENAITGETELQNMYVYVFDAATQNVDINGTALTFTANKADATIQVKAGKKRFYMLSLNDTQKAALDAAVGSTPNVTLFEKAVIESGLSADLTPTGIATASEFWIGTVWGETISIPEADIDSDNTTVNITLTIGRAAAKVKLTGVSYTGTANSQNSHKLLGAFETAAAQYRLGAVPKQFYSIGQYTGTTLPSYTDGTNTGVEVQSYVHDQAHNNGTVGTWNPAFRANTDFAWSDITATTTNMADFIYTVENTTNPALGSVNNLRYGNTTFMQIQVKYTPVAAEIVDVAASETADAITMNGTLAGDDFWTADIDGKTYIFDEDPSIVTFFGPKLDGAAKKYTGGINYYHFPITDENETKDVCRYRVLRNFYYEVTVSDIKGLGSNTPTVDAEEPIARNFPIEISIVVAPWSKVTQGGVILE